MKKNDYNDYKTGKRPANNDGLKNYESIKKNFVSANTIQKN